MAIIRTNFTSVPGGLLTFANLHYVKGHEVEYFYGNAYYDDIKMQVMYDFKTKEAVGHGGQKLPHDLWTPARNELQQYFRILTSDPNNYTLRKGN